MRLLILRDDRHFWSAYNVAPVVRAATLAARPEIGRVLDAVSPRITNGAVQTMNAAIENDQADPGRRRRQVSHPSTSSG